MISFSRKPGPYSCLSNMTKCAIVYNEEPFTCAEAAWQAQRCADPEERRCFFLLSGSAAKRLGAVINTRADWDSVKYDILVDVLMSKFNHNEDYRDVLLSTNDEEIIADTTGWHDNTWGKCSCIKCSSVPAMNLLGKALMQVRSNIREKM